MQLADWLREWLSPETVSLLTSRILRAMGVALLMEVAIFFLNRRVDRWLNPFLVGRRGGNPLWQMTRRRRLLWLPKAIIRLLLNLLGILFILGIFAVPMLPVYCWLVVVGLGFFIGARRCLDDVLCGYLLLLEEHFGEGDVVQVLGATGVVEKFGWRTIHLRSEDGRLHVVANREIRHATVQPKPQKSSDK